MQPDLCRVPRPRSHLPTLSRSPLSSQRQVVRNSASLARRTVRRRVTSLMAVTYPIPLAVEGPSMNRLLPCPLVTMARIRTAATSLPSRPNPSQRRRRRRRTSPPLLRPRARIPMAAISPRLARRRASYPSSAASLKNLSLLSLLCTLPIQKSHPYRPYRALR
jgi:hypothetical protein